eukprot:7910477-Karenia_brevis.AAC.1
MACCGLSWTVVGSTVCSEPPPRQTWGGQKRLPVYMYRRILSFLRRKRTLKTVSTNVPYPVNGVII